MFAQNDSPSSSSTVESFGSRILNKSALSIVLEENLILLNLRKYLEKFHEMLRA